VHWLYVHAGLNSGNSPWYLFPSGAFGYFGVLTIVWAVLRRLNCHQPRCWRIGRFPVEGSLLHACHRHHPSPPTHESIRKRYHLYAGKQIGDG
jgi:hypothetical protein